VSLIVQSKTELSSHHIVILSVRREARQPWPDLLEQVAVGAEVVEEVAVAGLILDGANLRPVLEQP